MKNLMKVVAVSDAKLDKNGKEYVMVTMQNPVYKTTIDETTGEVLTILSPALKTSHTAYSESYLDGAPEWLRNAKVGDHIEGSIERRAVATPYDFVGRDGETRTANTYTCAVFGDSEQSNWEDLVKAAFRRNGHPLPGDVVESKAAPKFEITSKTKKADEVLAEF